jgi:hypothetical protein
MQDWSAANKGRADPWEEPKRPRSDSSRRSQALLPASAGRKNIMEMAAVAVKLMSLKSLQMLT